ncbi:HK97 family phage prohead protease [Skermania sp. ID1734]|uniref:HK97 family phage prohead protease n=1 Tax=Skermania sp. ID1734 TaxID=2597516 RepID=UPI00117CF300|nr:HK97 family phage prohead protease [Skermania sp. ID1734]TSD95043.1 HK97 family phage prohead protease [Skermania sp. ID1734]
MGEILYRSAPVDSAEHRTVFGLAVPYGVETEIHDAGGDYTERFAYGAFGRSIAERGHKVRLMVSHDHRQLPIGKATELRESQDGLHAAFYVPESRAGDDALNLVKAGVVDSFSIGFRPIRSREVGNVVERIEASLYEISLVAAGAYEGATISGVRSEGRVIELAVIRRQLQMLDLLNGTEL